jgi:AcrR family transcriptional regulator
MFVFIQFIERGTTMNDDNTRRPRGRPPGSKAQVTIDKETEIGRDGKAVVRKDAILNRAKLIAAASNIMRETGGDVPFESIAIAAGVTRGTLYRNFADRQSLYEAVLDRDLDAMIAEIAELPDNDTLGFLRVLTEMMMVYDKFLSVFPAQSDYEADGVSEAKISAVIALPLARAKRKGVLREDLTGDDIQLVSRMLAANWRLDMKASFSEAFDDRLRLFMAGLGGSDMTRAGRPKPK